MHVPRPSPGEDRRLESLRRYEVLDTLPERPFDDLVALAAQICATPIALISFVDEDRQWFKASIGCPIQETPLDVSFCAHAVLEPGLFVVPDLTRDDRFVNNPFVAGEDHIRFYAGAPLSTPDGQQIGRLCVMDRVPRELTAPQRDALMMLSRQVVAQLELRLRARDETRYRTLFNHAPDGLLIADRDSYYLDANASMCAMLGYTRDELVGLHASDIVAPAEIPHIEPALEAIKTTADYHREWLFRRKDGSTFSGEVIATTIPDGTLLGMVRDVTERNRTIDALRAAEERMRFALEGAGVGIWDMDHATGVLQWSSILEAQHGVPRGSFRGTFEAFIACVHPDDRATLLESIVQSSHSGSDFVVQYRTVWPDGTVRWLSGAGRVLLGPERSPLRAVGISWDITDRKRAQDQLVRLNDEIERQRQRVFKATMRTVQDIVNNLLNGMQLVQLETEGKLPAETQRLLDDTICDAAAKLQSLGSLETIKERPMDIGVGIDYPGAA